MKKSIARKAEKSSDVKAFREVFRKIIGMSPLEYRGKYNKEAIV